jgi:hypothetical protein
VRLAQISLQRHLIYVSVPTLVLHLRDDVFVPFSRAASSPR